MYLYKCVNIKPGDVLFSNNKDRLFILSSEKEIEVVTNTSEIRALISTNNFQSSSSSYIHEMKNANYLTNHIFDENPKNTIYVLSDAKFDKEDFKYNANFYLITPSSTVDFDQHKKYLNSAQKDKKIRTGLTTQDIIQFAAAGNSKAVVWYSDNITSFSLTNQQFELSLNGFLGNVEAIEKNDSTGIVYEHNFSVGGGKKYFVIQANANRIDPLLNLQSDSFDLTKVIPYNYLVQFIKGPSPLNIIFGSFQSLVNKPEQDLYKALLTIMWLSVHSKDDFKGYRVKDESSPNFNKILVDETKLYGIATTEDIANTDFGSKILAYWENEYSLIMTNELSELYNRVKSFLGFVGTDVKSPYAYGSYDDINKLAFDFYFSFKASDFANIDIINSLSKPNIQLKSLKYDFDTTAGTITGLKPEWSQISGVKSFSLRNKYTLPSHVDRFIASEKVTSPKNKTLDTNDLFSYQWTRPLKNNYVNVFGTANYSGSNVDTTETAEFTIANADNFQNISSPFSSGMLWAESIGKWLYNNLKYGLENDNTNPNNGSMFESVDNYIKESGSFTFSENTTNIKSPRFVKLGTSDLKTNFVDDIKNFIQINFIGSANAVVIDDIKPTVTLRYERKPYDANGYLQLNPATHGRDLIAKFTWRQRVTIPASSIPTSATKFPYDLNAATLNQWKTDNGENDDKFILVEKNKIADDARLKTIDWYTALSPSIEFQIYGWDTAAKKFIPKTLKLPTKFAFDQSVIRGGLDF